MKWDAIAAIAELLAALGAIVSLVYLAGQVRSNLNPASQAAFQSLVNQMDNVWTRIAGDRSYADIWVRGSSGASKLEDEADGVRFSAFLNRPSCASRSWRKPRVRYRGNVGPRGEVAAGSLPAIHRLRDIRNPVHRRRSHGAISVSSRSPARVSRRMRAAPP